MTVSKQRKRFREVDVWQREFGPVSVRAVYDIFAQKFNIPMSSMKDYTFSHCVVALRKLENPNYEEPQDRKSENY